MTARVKLSDLITRSYRMAEIPEPSDLTTGFVTIPEIIEVINEGAAELQDLICEAYEDYFLTSTTKALAVGDRVVTLPDDFFKLRQLFLIDGNQRYEIFPMNLHDLAGTTTDTNTNRPTYRLTGNEILFSEGIDSALTLEIWYIREFKKMEDKKDELAPQIQNGWEKYIVAYAANYMLGKEESDPTVAVMAMEKAKQSISSLAHNRDASGPATVRDVSGRFSKRRILPIPKV